MKHRYNPFKKYRRPETRPRLKSIFTKQLPETREDRRQQNTQAIEQRKGTAYGT